jgi:hypothetical protein
MTGWCKIDMNCGANAPEFILDGPHRVRGYSGHSVQPEEVRPSSQEELLDSERGTLKRAIAS